MVPLPIRERTPIKITYEPENPKTHEIAKYIIGFIIVVVIIWVLLYLFQIKLL